jgi:hypothetical protein
MNVNLRKWAVLVAAAAMVLVAMAVVGCSSNNGSSDAPAASSQPAPAAPAPGGEAGHEMSPDMVMPAGTIPEIWTQIAGEQTKLTAAIQNGQLKDVHHLAFGIRDLVVALADKAKAATLANSAKLDGMVEQVKASATKLDELGDAGNLSGTQAEYAKLETVLGAIKSVTGGK